MRLILLFAGQIIEKRGIARFFENGHAQNGKEYTSYKDNRYKIWLNKNKCQNKLTNMIKSIFLYWIKIQFYANLIISGYG